MVAIQIRDVPESIRDDLAREAKHRGISLQVLLREMIEREARIAHNREFLRTYVPPKRAEDEPVDVAALIRQQRAEREQHLVDVASGRST